MRLAALLLVLAGPVAAQEARQLPATLIAHAQLPAQSFVVPPVDAPRYFMLAGRFIDGERRETPYGGTVGATGHTHPFPGQPLQGFSGIRSLRGDRFLLVSDNGFGSKANSSDVLLMLHEARADWQSGRLIVERTVFLSDPDRVVPFPIQNEASEARHLTGADFDIESIQPVEGGYWIGDEFGPFLLRVSDDGVVRQVVPIGPDDAPLRSPDNPFLVAPNPGETMEGAVVPRSGGFEGMALSEDGTTLYPLLERAVILDGTPEAIGGQAVLRMFEVDVGTGTFTDTIRYYPLEDPSHAIGDFNMIGDTRALVIERDGGQGEASFSDRPAEFKRVYLIDLARTDADGVLEKIAFIDLLDIADPDGVAPRGTVDGTFTFPFVTIEGVDRVGEGMIVVGNDNNYPFSVGREAGRADDSELILLSVPELLMAE